MELKKTLQYQGNILFKYRSYLPIIMLIIALYFHYLTEIKWNYFILEDSKYEIYYEMFCLLISLFGLFIRIYTVGYTPKNTSGRNTKEQVADSLNTTGIYSIVRNPLYLGNYFMYFGICLITGNLWFLILSNLIFWIYYFIIIFAEEQFLEKKFGVEFIEWADRTPIIIPRFSQYVRSNFSFNIKKVLRQEKDGFFVLFLLFALFNVSAKLFYPLNDFNYILLISCGVALVIYCVLKFLKSKTNILND
ncbi:MAG: isoprenylcysteine carboxylmethyltransferase family protein [Bacteroidetes bacterium]|nr:isoprenylcysteine carboxylmethyltransferase family protein [Bacteroidota bacterium]